MRMKGYNIFLIFMIYEFGSAFAKCPNHWMRYSNNCYLFVTRYPMEWIDAMTFCRSYGAMLAEIKSFAEDYFLRHEARRLGGNFWLGGSDILVDRVWKWMSSKTSFSYSGWASGEPNVSYGAGEHCVHLYKDRNYYWNDERCENRFNFICQRAA
ncbi:ladderlectin-like [Saccostrea cucullata]|uniref:ladderlectin-like n=1 Tax=Saccostrea cuccullata TaxID=36930 RepID=UPI002ED33AD4